MTVPSGAASFEMLSAIVAASALNPNLSSSANQLAYRQIPTSSNSQIDSQGVCFKLPL